MSGLEKVKILHCADLHLDAPFTSLGSIDGVPTVRRQELKAALQRITNMAAAEKADLLLVCGDLFEHGYIRKPTIKFISGEFEKIRDTKILLIPGNHDPLSAGSYYESYIWPDNVYILSGKNPVFQMRDAGVCVFGGSPGKYDVDDSKINILMLHGTLDMGFNRDAYNPLSSGSLEASGMDYIALGHFHNKIEHAGIFGSIFNPGSPEPLGFDEEGEHGVFMASIEKYGGDDSRLEVDFKPVNKRFYRNMKVRADSCRNDEEAADLISEVLDSSADLYNISVSGTTEQGFRLNAKNILTALKDKVFFIKVKDETIPDYDFETLATEPGLRGLFVSKMLKRASGAKDEEEKQLIMQALYYGMEAIEQGRICI